MPSEEIIESIRQRARNPECDSCGSSSWAIQDGEFALVEVSSGDLDLGSGIGTTAVVCQGCGYIRLYSNLIGG
jgi:hypothetical protein